MDQKNGEEKMIECQVASSNRGEIKWEKKKKTFIKIESFNIEK